MLPALLRRDAPFPELSYANAGQARLTRAFIRTVETLSGRARYARLYGMWRTEIASGPHDIFARMLRLIDVNLEVDGTWPPAAVPASPLVIIANHPFGIGDEIAALALAERLGRPFRVLIHKDLLKISEMAPYSLPVDFSDTLVARQNNLAMRAEALALLKSGVTIVVFPAGGVATAPRGFGKAVDLPWKTFAARLVQEARAAVLPVRFAGQNGRLFHLVSVAMNCRREDGRLAHLAARLSLVLRLSLLIREFARLSGRRIEARVGRILPWEELQGLRDRRLLTAHLHAQVFGMEREGDGASRTGRSRRALRRRLLLQSGISADGTASSSVARTSTS